MCDGHVTKVNQAKVAAEAYHMGSGALVWLTSSLPSIHVPEAGFFLAPAPCTATLAASLAVLLQNFIEDARLAGIRRGVASHCSYDVDASFSESGLRHSIRVYVW